MEFRISIMRIFSFIGKPIPKKRLIDAELIRTDIQGEYNLRIKNNTKHVHLVKKFILNGNVFPDDFIVNERIRKSPFLLFPGEVIQYSLYSSIEELFEDQNQCEIHIKEYPDDIVITQNLKILKTQS